MTNRQSLYEMMKRKASCLCVGLDPDPDRIPAHLGKGVEAMEAFCHGIVQATHSYLSLIHI